MIKVTLVTSNGEFVVSGKIPVFLIEPPSIIMWGIRLFSYNDSIATDEGEVLVYREAFSVALVEVDDATK